MSVNKNMDSQQYKQTLKSVFPTQFEPGSLADRLLIQGREEGREEGRKSVIATVRMLEELLNEPVSTVDTLMTHSLNALTTRLTELQHRLRDRQT